MRMATGVEQGKSLNAYKVLDSCATHAHNRGNDMAQPQTSQANGRVPVNITLPEDLRAWAKGYAKGTHHGDVSHLLESLLTSRKVREQIEARKKDKRKSKKQ